MTPPQISAANRRLKAFLRSDAAYRAYLPTSTWTSGGCWLLAQALQHVLGGKLVALKSEGGIEHVVLQVGERFVDGDGFSLRASLLGRWREQEGMRVHVVPFDGAARSEAILRGVPKPHDGMVAALSVDLSRVLGGA